MTYSNWGKLPFFSVSESYFANFLTLCFQRPNMPKQWYEIDLTGKNGFGLWKYEEYKSSYELTKNIFQLSLSPWKVIPVTLLIYDS